MIDTNETFLNVTSLGALSEYGFKRVVIAVGVFDGVHIGHQLLIKRLLEMAKTEDAVPVALTFFPHPRNILQPDSPPALLMSPAKKVELLHSYGVEAVVTMPFSKDFASLSPEDFIRNCLSTPRIDLRGICVGSSWRFGSEGKGDVTTLEKFAEKGHFKFEAVEELLIGSEPVSSTAIRRAISSGLLERAAEMLGRNYRLGGEVEAGRKIAGSTLEHPTANLHIRYGIVPPNGVYAGIAHFNGKDYPSAVAIGVSPTFRTYPEGNIRIEVHLLDFKGDIYGESIEVELLSYLREERCFSSASELKTQILEDVSKIKEILQERL
jgi:riboflavin kinase/FMN adenylyltransferase